MTVSIELYRASFSGNDVTDEFTIPFRFEQDADLVVTLFSSAGVGTLQTITTHYSATGEGDDSGGTLTMVTPPATGESLLIERNTDGAQGVNLTASGSLQAETLEDALDLRVLASQEAKGEAARSIRIHPIDDATDLTLPLEADRGNTVVAFDSDGTGLEVGPTADEVSNAQTYATNAAASAVLTAADVVSTNADVVSTNADVVSTNADVVTTEAARDAAIAASETLAYGYTFDDGTADADPGSAKFRFDNATFGSATFMYINETSDEGSLAATMDVWDDSSSTIKATVKVRNPLDTSEWFEFYVSGTITDAGDYRKVPIPPIASNGTIPTGTGVLLGVFRNGDAGTGAVDSFISRTGAVVAVASDYDASQIDNDSGVAGAFVDNALDQLDTDKQEELSGATLTGATVSASDKVLVQDADDSDNLKTVTTQAIADLRKTESIIIACSDETSDLEVADDVVNFRMPYAFTLTAVRASVSTAPTGAGITVDIEEAGSTILSTLLTIDATEKTSTTAATPAVISDSALADDAEISINIDVIGSTLTGAGLKVALIGYQT